MTTKKLVVVMGATGAQGGSLVRALLADGTFQVRGITRDTTSPNSQQLTAQGVEMVQAHASHKDQLIAAFTGAYAVFAVTNFWDKEILMNDHSLEEKQGKLIVDAIQHTKPAHFIFSSLPYTAKISKGKYDKVVHFDGKARVEEYCRQNNVPATFLHAPFYMSNLIYFTPPHVNADGNLEFVGVNRPDAPIATMDVHADFGKVALGILKAGPTATLNKDVYAASEFTTFAKIAETFTKITGRKTVYKQVPRAAYKAMLEPNMGPVVAEEFVQMLEYFDEFGYFGGEGIKACREYCEKMNSLEEWLKASGYKGPQ